jgi:FtsZ-interacting cell division protein ZipA
VPRINSVKKAQKDQGSCNRCGKAIKKGDSYRWIKFRHGGKRKRCSEYSCRFRQSDLTQSDKLSRTYGAQEAAEDAIGGLDTASESFEDDINGALQEAAEEIREVAQEYQESADNIRENFSESPTADECEEKSGELESWADELDEFEPGQGAFDPADRDLPEKFDDKDVERDPAATDEEHAEKVEEAREEYEEKLQEAREEWGDDLRTEAEGILSNCPV